MKPIDIFITAFQRSELTLKTLEYLYERTIYPFRVWLLDQAETNKWVGMQMEQAHPENFKYISFSENLGIHAAWNVAVALTESEYFITSDNDIYVPDLVGNALIPNTLEEVIDNRDWLERLVRFMDERPDFAAISLHPHVFIGAESIDPHDPEDVKERNMCGAVMRIMRTEAVRQVGGWEHRIEAGRNHEERYVCGKLQENGWKTGICSRIRAFHPFPPNWGYPKDFTPEMQKHNPELEKYVQQFGNIENYDPLTWLKK